MKDIVSRIIPETVDHHIDKLAQVFSVRLGAKIERRPAKANLHNFH